MPFIDHFGMIAPFYDRVIKTRKPDRLIGLLGLPVGGWLLDAGGGTGRIADILKGMALNTIVADVSLEMLRQANLKNKLTAVCTYTEKLPFLSHAFDAVVMVDAFHHVINQPETARELFRVLRPGRRLVIEEPDIQKVSVKFVAIGEKMLLMRSHFLSPKQIANLFAGFDAKISIERERWNAWIIVEKMGAETRG
ncbi:MAG: class I SAM-dependent methyltransferase [Omnitrophica WOR_2 bacterium]